MSLEQEFVGKTFGRLRVLARAPKTTRNHRWICECDCGKTTEVFGFCLRNGNTKSCGNHNPRNGATTHGLSRTRAYTAWDHMLQRCGNTNNPNYKHYGGRGISVCEKWLTFEGFHDDMGDQPAGLTLERKNNALGYCKSNCDWVTQQDQCNNTRTNRRIEYDGLVLTVAQWRRKQGFKRGLIEGRLRLGWPISLALTVQSGDRR